MSHKNNGARFFTQKCGFGFMRAAAIINIGALLAILGLIFVESCRSASRAPSICTNTAARRSG